MTIRTAPVFTFKDWLGLPLTEKYVMKWYLPPFYREPFALSMEDWKQFNDYAKKNHPIEFFFRYTLNNYLGKWENRFSMLYYKIKNIIFNPRAKMRKAVFPAEYHDLPSIIDQFHFEVIKEFIDREKCFEVNVYGDKEGKQFKKQILAYYKYITKDREALLNKVFSANRKFNSKYMDLVKQKDTELAIWVINNREKLWT